MFQGPSDKHERDAQKYLERIADGYVFDIVYKPKGYAERKHTEDQKPGSDKWHRFFTNPKRDWVTVVIGIGTLLVVGAYTEFARRQWCEMKKAADAAKEAANTAAEQLEMSERPWVDAQITVGGPLTFEPNGANIALNFGLLNSGHSPALDTYIDVRAAYDDFSFPRLDAEKLRDESCNTASEDIRLIPNFGVSLFPGHLMNYPKTAMIDSQDMAKRRTGKLWPGKLPNLQVIACIAYRPKFGSKLIYHTGYIIYLQKDRPDSMFSIGENVPAKHLKVVFLESNSVRAD